MLDAAAPGAVRPPRNMRWVPGGTFAMGGNDFYAEERPVHTREVAGFWMDEHPVTSAEFRRFVRATGHVTEAERAPAADDFPDAEPAQLVPGSLVFTPPTARVSLDDFRAWWSWVPGADWRHPEGPGSNLDGRERHPVTHVAYADATAYAAWAGKALPREDEWEYAARGGIDGATFAWGEEFMPRGRVMANTWHGDFPLTRDPVHPFRRTSPVGHFPPNGYGLVDVTGNVWEWTCDPFTATHEAAAGMLAQTSTDAAAPHACCGGDVRRPGADVDPATRVIKGGSHLCAPTYCLRYRPAARQSQTVDTSTSHLGFRCLLRPGA